MAKRLLFKADEKNIGVEKTEIEFQYYNGFALIQTQKSINSLHKVAEESGYKNILEISTKSPVSLGVKLSAFNLCGKKEPFIYPVENIFQSSKIFENGGPYTELLNMEPGKAKKDIRLKTSGNIIGFKFFNYEFDKNPPTFFYDWIYINSLIDNGDYLNEIVNYQCFTDIAFNHKKSINCQAYSAALLRSLLYNNFDLNEVIEPNRFQKALEHEYKNIII